MDLHAFPKLNGEPILWSTDLVYEDNTVVISLFPLDMPMVERLLNAGHKDKFGVTIGKSKNVITLGSIQRVKLSKVDSPLDEATKIDITITLSK